MEWFWRSAAPSMSMKFMAPIVGEAKAAAGTGSAAGVNSRHANCSGLNCATPTDARFSFTGFSQRGGAT